MYDEQERTVQRQNIELNDRVKKFERQLEVLKHDPRDEEKEIIKRALAKQAKEYQRLLAKKDEQIEGLNEKIQQNSHVKPPPPPENYSSMIVFRSSPISFKRHYDKLIWRNYIWKNAFSRQAHH